MQCTFTSSTVYYSLPYLRHLISTVVPSSSSSFVGFFFGSSYVAIGDCTTNSGEHIHVLLSRDHKMLLVSNNHEYDSCNASPDLPHFGWKNPRLIVSLPHFAQYRKPQVEQIMDPFSPTKSCSCILVRILSWLVSCSRFPKLRPNL